MKTIHKYQLKVMGGPQRNLIPIGARFCSAGVQGEFISMWFDVDTDNPKEQRNHVVCATGGEKHPSARKFLATVFDGPFVWHVFEAV